MFEPSRYDYLAALATQTRFEALWCSVVLHIQVWFNHERGFRPSNLFSSALFRLGADIPHFSPRQRMRYKLYSGPKPP